MIHVLHVITGLARGGAETMLYKLLSATDRESFSSEVVSLKGNGPLAAPIARLGVPLHSLDLKPGVGMIPGLLRLARRMHLSRPHVVQTWMYHADLLGGLAARLAGGVPVAWGLRQSALERRESKRSHLWVIRLCARWSRWLPARIVCGSEAAREVHVGLGYASDRMVVIPNGFDLASFRPDPVARREVRAELGLSDSTPLVAMVGRFHPQKDHRTFLEAAGELRDRVPQVRFLLCGPGIDADNAELREWISAVGLEDAFHLLGDRSDVARIYAAMDVATLTSSFGEGFPNVIGEAMACGVPCVVTDVGDAARIVAETGIVVPPRSPTVLAQAWEALVGAGPQRRQALGSAARKRVAELFSLPAIVGRYEVLYKELGAARGA